MIKLGSRTGLFEYIMGKGTFFVWRSPHLPSPQKESMATGQRRTNSRLTAIWQLLLLISLTIGSSQLIAVAASPKGRSTASRPAQDFGIPQVAMINRQIEQSWIDNEVTPSSVATDGEYCRRLFLDLIGATKSEIVLPMISRFSANKSKIKGRNSQFIEKQTSTQRTSQMIPPTANTGWSAARRRPSMGPSVHRQIGNHRPAS